MRRFLLAAGLALVLHGFLMTVKVDWFKNKAAHLKRPEPISLALTYRHPERIAAPALKRPEPSSQKAVPRVRRPEKRKASAKQLKKVRAVPDKKGLQPVSPPVLKPDEDRPEEALQEFVPEDPQPRPPPSSSLEEVPPAYKEIPAPEYPRTAKTRRYEGTVVLKVLVNREGKVGDLRLLQSSGYRILDRAAMKSVKDWLFKPGKRGDKEVEMWIDVPVRFELK